MAEQVSRQRKTKRPCQVCFLNPTLCLCALIPKLDFKTRLTLIIHVKELKRTTNTGRLALAALVNSEMVVRGAPDQPLDLLSVLNPDYQPLLFYPADGAIELTPNFGERFEKPIQLLVPDGNWRQAGKIHYRHKELADIPRVKISTPNTATKHLRLETTPEGMATLEAIAQAYLMIEGREAGDTLSALYREKLERTLRGRGQ